MKIEPFQMHFQTVTDEVQSATHMKDGDVIAIFSTGILRIYRADDPSTGYLPLCLFDEMGRDHRANKHTISLVPVETMTGTMNERTAHWLAGLLTCLAGFGAEPIRTPEEIGGRGGGHNIFCFQVIPRINHATPA